MLFLNQHTINKIQTNLLGVSKFNNSLDLMIGKVSLNDLPPTLPKLRTAEAWDGQDAPPQQVENPDL